MDGFYTHGLPHYINICTSTDFVTAPYQQQWRSTFDKLIGMSASWTRDLNCFNKTFKTKSAFPLNWSTASFVFLCSLIEFWTSLEKPESVVTSSYSRKTKLRNDKLWPFQGKKFWTSLLSAQFTWHEMTVCCRCVDMWWMTSRYKIPHSRGEKEKVNAQQGDIGNVIVIFLLLIFNYYILLLEIFIEQRYISSNHRWVKISQGDL